MSRPLELSGKTFGYLTVLDKNGKSNGGKIKWLCRCRCGKEVSVIGSELVKGTTKSCGCYHREMSSTKTTKVHPGDRYGRLLVLERCGSKDNYALFRCRCDCGNELVVVGRELWNGHTKSCGCLRSDITALRNMQTKRIHGGTKMGKPTRLYRIYNGMHTRCYNKSDPTYKYYGGRGIKICDEWLEDFSKFMEWSLSHNYSDDLSIDRIDVNGDYCPENCRWATIEQQANNTTKSIFLEYDGQRMTVMQWARKLNINPATLYSRLSHGWDVESVLTTPPLPSGYRRKNITKGPEFSNLP